jgi:hypothetical protein
MCLYNCDVYVANIFEVQTAYIYFIFKAYSNAPLVMFNYLKMVILNATEHKHVVLGKKTCCVAKVFIFLNITETPITTWNHFNYVTKLMLPCEYDCMFFTFLL